MKKFKSTYVLLGVFVALLLLAVFFASDSAERRRNSSETSAPVFSSSLIKKVDQIVFSSPTVEPLSLTKSDEGFWKVAETRVDADEQEKLLTALNEFPQGKMVSRNKLNWEQYGVTAEGASQVVLMQGDQELSKIFFGTMGTNYQAVYYREDGQDVVKSTSTALDDFSSYDADRWKNKHLFVLDSDDVEAAVVRIGEEKWQFQKSGSGVQWMENGEWKDIEDVAAFKTYMDTLFTLKADSIEMDSSLFDTADTALAITLQDGSEYVVSLDKKDDGQTFVRITDQPDLLKFSSDITERFRPEFLKPAEPAPSETSLSTEIAPE